MNKKIILIILGMVFIIGIIAWMFIFLNNSESLNKCGDGVCDSKEKLNPNLCTKDCGFLIGSERCGPNNNGYCIDFKEKCKTGYEGIGPDKCRRGRSTECCVPVEKEKTCSEQNGTVCSSSQTCSGSWLDASDSERCCNGECQQTTTSDYEDSPFGFIQGEVVYGQRPKATFLVDLGVHWNKGAPKDAMKFPSKDINDIDFGAEVDFTNLDEYVKEIFIDNGVYIYILYLL